MMKNTTVYCMDCGEFNLKDYDGLRKCGCNREKTVTASVDMDKIDPLEVLIEANGVVSEIITIWRHLDDCSDKDKDEKRWLSEDLWDKLMSLQEFLNQAVKE